MPVWENGARSLYSGPIPLFDLNDLFGSPQPWGRRDSWRQPAPRGGIKDYFTSPDLLKIFKGQNPGQPVAVHMENTGFMWDMGLDNPGRAEPPDNHGMICTKILRGDADKENESFLGYQYDGDPYTRDTLTRLSSNPAVKLLTISSVKGINDDKYEAARLP